MTTRQNIAGGKTVEVSTRIPAELAARLRQVAFERGVSQALVIVQAIEAELARRDQA